MSRLPEKGEATAAAEALERRLHAIGDGENFVAEVNVNTDDMRGEGPAVRAAYGDLFVIGEMAQAAEIPVNNFIYDIATGTMPDVALRSMYLLAVAHGVLMERARWERKP